MALTGTTTAKDEDEFLRGWLHQILYCVVRGAIASLPMIKVEKIMLVACHTVARIICELYAGDDVSVYRFRKAARDLFDDTTKQMPVVPMPSAHPVETDTAVIG